MSQVVKNLRVRRTQKLLQDALIELIETDGFEVLTVGQITERAMISRAAFYRNYQDKYDLVERIFAEAMQALSNAVALPATAHSPQIWVNFFTHIDENDRLYGALLGRKGSPWFVQKMRTSLIELLKQYEHLSSPDHPVYPATYVLIPNLLAAIIIETITWWLEQGKPYPAEEVAKHSLLLASAIFKETSTWQS